jgi:hypothetical protein
VPNTKPDHERVNFAWLLKYLYAVRFDQVPCSVRVERRQPNPEIVASSPSRIERHLASDGLFIGQIDNMIDSFTTDPVALPVHILDGSARG